MSILTDLKFQSVIVYSPKYQYIINFEKKIGEKDKVKLIYNVELN